MPMKRWFALLFALALLCGAALAEGVKDVADAVAGLPYAPEVSDAQDALVRCDFITEGDSAVITWTDGALAYTVHDAPEALAPLYQDLLSRYAWQAGLVAVDGEVVSALDTDAVTYVLNTNTKKFHHPDCPSAAKIKLKNRRDFAGAREEAVEMGFTPCGNCKP